jgi:serine/threonine protein phosphatase 1
MVTPQRIIAIGDVHGCIIALDSLLALLELKGTDLLVTLGDYVDRGPDSKRVLDRLIELYEAGRLIPLRGNHELMMLRARDSVSEERFWRNYGGDDALDSYGSEERAGRLQDVPDRHWRFIASDCRDHYEVDDVIFAHAGVHPLRPLDEQTEDDLYWRSLTDCGRHVSGKTVICGHTVQHEGLPKHLGHTICIDTGAYCQGWLTALDVRSQEYWQASDFGETRRGTLDAVVPGARPTLHHSAIE